MFSSSAVSRPVVPLQGSLLSTASITRASSVRGTGRLASKQSHQVNLGIFTSRQQQHSTRAAAAVEQQQQGSSDSLDLDEQPVAAPAAASEVVEPVPNDVGAAAAATSSDAGSSDAGWSAFLETLWQRGYFDEHSSGKDK